MKNLKYLVNKANESLKEAIQYIDSVSECFGRTNLKLYDLCYALYRDPRFSKYDDDYLGDMFNLFCEDNYMFFQEWEAEEGIEDIREYIGRTSTFTLKSGGVFKDGEFYLYNTLRDNFEEFLDYRAIDWVDCCVDYELGITQLNYEAIQEYLKHERTEFKEDSMYYLKYSLEYIISGEFLTNLKTTLADGVKEYNYIKDFKEGSIDLFIEFLEDQEEEE